MKCLTSLCLEMSYTSFIPKTVSASLCWFSLTLSLSSPFPNLCSHKAWEWGLVLPSISSNCNKVRSVCEVLPACCRLHVKRSCFPVPWNVLHYTFIPKTASTSLCWSSNLVPELPLPWFVAIKPGNEGLYYAASLAFVTRFILIVKFFLPVAGRS